MKRQIEPLAYATQGTVTMAGRPVQGKLRVIGIKIYQPGERRQALDRHMLSWWLALMIAFGFGLLIGYYTGWLTGKGAGNPKTVRNEVEAACALTRATVNAAGRDALLYASALTALQDSNVTAGNEYRQIRRIVR